MHYNTGPWQDAPPQDVRHKHKKENSDGNIIVAIPNNSVFRPLFFCHDRSKRVSFSTSACNTYYLSSHVIPRPTSFPPYLGPLISTPEHVHVWTYTHRERTFAFTGRKFRLNHQYLTRVGMKTSCCFYQKGPAP